MRLLLKYHWAKEVHKVLALSALTSFLNIGINVRKLGSIDFEGRSLQNLKKKLNCIRNEQGKVFYQSSL